MPDKGKIERLELYHVDVPLPTPFFPAWIPGYSQDHLRYTLLRVTTKDGLIGHATGSAIGLERETLGDFIGPFLVGIDPYDVDAVSDRLRQASVLGWRNAWMEVAFWDLAAQARDISLSALIRERLGQDSPKTPAPVKAYASFGEVRTVEARAEAIERAARVGFKSVKVNLTRADFDEDISALRAAKAVAGDEIGLLAHGRQTSAISLVESLPSWDVDRARGLIDVAKEVGVRWIQEPLGPNHFHALRELSSSGLVPLAGGDTAQTRADLDILVDRGCYSVLTPDVSFAGVANTVHLMRRCHEARLGYSASVYGDGISLLANLHLQSAWCSLEDTAGPKLFEVPWEPPAMIPELRDALMTEPTHVERDGTLSVPDKPGLGLSIDPKKLKRFGQKFYTLTPVRFVVASARQSGLRRTAAYAQGAKDEVRSGH